VAVEPDDRVLVKDQTNTSQNSVYVCKTGDWELASDFNQRGDVVKGSLVLVTEGTANGLKDWYVTTSGRPWPGRETIQFAQHLSAFSSIDLTRIADPAAAGAGIDRLYADLDGRLSVTEPGGTKLYVTARPEFSVWVDGQAQGLPENDTSPAALTTTKTRVQAALDYAINNRKQLTSLSAGRLNSDPGLYIDPPGNLRSTPSAPTIFDFSHELRGAGGIGNHEGHGTQLTFTDNTAPALIVGTGHGMAVRHLSVLGPTGATSRAALAANGVGIGLAGGSSGLSRVLIEGVQIENFRAGIKTGYNGANALCDSVTLNKTLIAGCYRGFDLTQSNNLIISLTDANFADNTSHVWESPGNAINIVGGNYSTTSAQAKAFTISSVSVLSSFTDDFAGNSFTNWTFTATLSAPNQPMADGAYDAFAILTTNFGLVPLLLAAYNSGTGIATLKFYPGWLKSLFNTAANLKNDTAIESDLQAATTLYACETVTIFRGYGINAQGVHFENPGVLTRLIDVNADFGGDRQSKLSRLYANYLVNHGNLAAGTADQKAVFYNQLVHPFIRQVGAGLKIEDSKLDSKEATQDGVVIELWSNSGYDLKVSNHNLVRPNFYLPLRSLINPSDETWPSMVRGAGVWDSTPFIPVSGTPYNAFPYANNVPFEGFAPASWAIPRLQPAQLAAIEAGPGSLGTYPPLHGETPYRVLDDASSGPSATVIARSNHKFWSYGQNLAITWTFEGMSPVLRLTDMSRMFAGLQVTLDNGVDGDIAYVITGVYITLGYATATAVSTRYGTSNETVPLFGDKTTTYTAATVKQEAYAVARTGTLPASKFTTNSTVGVTTAAQGDLTGADFVNLKLSAVGSTNYTTRTAALMFGDIPGCYSGYKYMLAVSNVSTGNTVLAGGSNVTVNSTGNIPASSVRMFEVRFTSTAAVTIDGQLST
jgi:hypothetical protein